MSDWRSWDFGSGFKKVLRKYYPDMIKKINPKEILPYLPSLLCSASDEEEILHEQQNRGARSAVYKLKECLLRKGRTEEFIEALREVGLTDLADKMVEDLESACGRQTRKPQTQEPKGDMPPVTLVERGQGDMPPMTLVERGQGDTRVTMTHCVVRNLQIGATSHMAVTEPGDNRTVGDRLNHEASAGDSENGGRQSLEAQLESTEINDQVAERLAESNPAEPQEKANGKEFQSRFITDFDPKSCLGKGGFGVVFEALNKMDDRLYAIKRIPLKNSERAKQKVMREVKALAKLDHPGIVRYYQSWFESPPPGWQKQQDQRYHDMFSTADTGFSVSVGVGMSSGSESHHSQDTDDSLLSKSNAKVTDTTDSLVVFEDSQPKGDSDSHSRQEMSDKFSQLRVGQHSGDTSTSTSRQSSDTSVTTNEPHLLLYIQMELCRRESLSNWLLRKELDRDPKHNVLYVFDQILLAVDYVHKCGMIHRDLKPSNIFFSLDGTVKVGDFGLVTATEEHVTEDVSDIWGDRATSQTPRRHTNQVGTKLYMSPEQIAGEDYTHKVDIFALGMICFELFHPFTTGAERVETLLAVKQLKFPEKFSRELPSKCAFLKPLLSHDPSDRPDTKDIRSHALLADFEKARAAAERLRTAPTPKPQSDSPTSDSPVNKDNS